MPLVVKNGDKSTKITFGLIQHLALRSACCSLLEYEDWIPELCHYCQCVIVLKW